MTRQFVKYSLVGAANTLITLGTYLGLVAAGVDYVLASAAGYSLGAINSYVLNYRWTFVLNGVDHRRTVSRFAVVQTYGIAANLGLIYLLVHDADLGKAPAQLVVTLLVLSSTFGMNKLWAFAQPDEAVVA